MRLSGGDVVFFGLTIFGALCFLLGYLVAGRRLESNAAHRIYLAERKARWMMDWIKQAIERQSLVADSLQRAVHEYQSETCENQPAEPRGCE